MRIGLTADLQFDEHVRYSTLGDDGVPTRLRDQLDCFRWIVDTCHKRDLDRLYVLGDIFDSRTTISLSVLDLVCRNFKIADTLPIYLLVGNHDSYLRDPRRNSLQVLRGVVERVIEEPYVEGRCAFVPWCDDIGQYGEWIDGVAGTTAEYLFTHVLIEEAGYPGKGVPLEVLRPAKWRRIFAGDVHSPVAFVWGDCSIQYVGSPLQIDFRDTGDWRGFAIFDTESDELEMVENLKSPRFYLVRNEEEAAQVESDDFARVKVENPVKQAKLLEDLRSRVAWVDGDCVEVVDSKPRLEVEAKTTRKEVLKKYCEYKGVKTDVDTLVELGSELLEEAEG